jgi:serine/threonine protein kinase
MDATPVCPICGKAVAPDAPEGLCPECLMKSGFDTRPQGEAGANKPRFVVPAVEEIAALFPHLEIIGLLGQGGMGAVYKARQPALDRFVALKVLPSASAEDPGFAERFNREARALARLNHPNIVAVYDFGQAGGMPYFLMEYVEGSTLRQVAQAGRLSPRETLGIVVQICEALQFAHDEGVVHRDIKPENILLDAKGRVKIADFGIAKVLDQAPQDIALTGAREVMGTAHYMAPEQFEHPQSVDHRADIFSLGVVFYELLTGELPLGKFAPPSQKVQADARLDGVVLHTLEKEPDRRYQHASEVKTDVETIAATPGEGQPPMARIPPLMPPVAGQASRASNAQKIVLVAGGFGLAALLILICLAALFIGVKWKLVTTRAAASLSSSNAFWASLNQDQRLIAQWTDTQFRNFDDRRTFEGWTQSERAQVEQRAMDALRGPVNDQYFQAISTLAALRSTNALPALRELACDHEPSRNGNRPRWMAARALGIIGDKAAVPELIHLLYYDNVNVRWWGQISLVRLTGTNFGNNWQAWGRWWNQTGGQPPFKAEQVRWSNDPQDSDPATLEKQDRTFLGGLQGQAQTKATPVKAQASGPRMTTNPPDETAVPFAEPGQPIVEPETPERTRPAEPKR